jgi:hypothetical protein
MGTNKPMNMRMDTETLKQIDAQAKIEHRDRSGMIRHMIAYYLEYYASPPPHLPYPISNKICLNFEHMGYKGPITACLDCAGGIRTTKEYGKAKKPAK